MVRKIKNLIQERKWKKQRARRGFSDFDVYEIKTWFINIVPKMLSELIDNNQGYPSFIEDEYYENHHINEEKLTDDEKKHVGEECFKKWTDILKEMEKAFLEANPETCSFKNKYEDDYQKAFEEYKSKYGYRGEKVKNNHYIKHNPDGSEVHSANSPYYMENMEKYKEIVRLYKEEDRRRFEYITEAKKKALDMFVKYFDDLWW